MAKKAVVKALVVPVSLGPSPYGEDADKVKFANPKNPKEPDTKHQVSRRIGYFERQLQCFRQEIEELEDKFIAPIPAVKDVKEIESLKRTLDMEKDFKKNLQDELDALQELYDKAAEALHTAGLRCPEFENEDCDICQKAAEEADTKEEE